VKKRNFEAACRQRFKVSGRDAGDDDGGDGVVLAFGFGGMGGVPDHLRAQMEADGFEVRQVGPDEYEAVRVEAAEVLPQLS
jgi:hypothetical protein